MSTEAEHSPDIAFARPPPAPEAGDEPFQQSLAELTRQLANRLPLEPPAFDPKAADRLPREPKEPARRQRRARPALAVFALLLGVGLAFILHGLFAAAPESPARPVVTAIAPPLPEPVPPPSATEVQPAKPVTIDPPPPVVTPVVAPEPPAPTGKLLGYEIMEIQTRLKASGLNPGPLDGMSGSQTSSAIKEYQAAKGWPQTGKLDRDLLGQLRQEPDRSARQ